MWTLRRSWGSILAILAVIVCILGVVNAFNIELFDEKHFKGRHTSVDVRGCTNLPKEWDDLVSSIDPSQCVIIFKHPNCQGPRVRLEPSGFGTAYLKEINFEDKISSAAPCSIATARGRDEH